MANGDPRQVAGPSGESSRKGKGRKRKGPPEKNKKKSGNKKAYVPSYVPEGEKCVVCGDYSTGSHYRAMTCEGCKGFFRRTIQKSEGLEPNLVCKREQQCEISPQTRNACQYCRYKKCLAARMDPNSVLTEKQRRHLKHLIDSNRIERQKKEFQTLSPQELSMLLHIGNSYKSEQVADFYKFVHEDDIDSVDQSHSETDMSPSLIHAIQFVWSIPGIQKMNEDDLIKLFYNHLLDIVGFRLAELFDTKRNELRFKNFHLQESDLEKYSYMEEIFNFAKYYSQFITSDGVILGCLCAIRFLSIDNATLVCEETVSKNVEVIQTALIKYLVQEKDLPMHALFSHLVNFENIREYHSKLLTKLACLGSCSENVFGLSFNPDYSEMFGLGQVKTFDICSSPSFKSENGANSKDDEPKKGSDPLPGCSSSAWDFSEGEDGPDRKQPKKADKGKRLVSKSKKHQPKRTKDCSVQANPTEIKSGEGNSGKIQREPITECVKENLKSIQKETLKDQASFSTMSPWYIAQQGHDPLCGQSSFGFANMPRAVKINLTEAKCQPGPSRCQDPDNGYAEIKQPLGSAGLLDLNKPSENRYTKPPISLDSPHDLPRSYEAHSDPQPCPRQDADDAIRKGESTARQSGVCSPQTREELSTLNKPKSSLHEPRETVPMIENGAPLRIMPYCILHENPGAQKPEDLAPKRPETCSSNRREEAPVISVMQRKDHVVPPVKEENVVPPVKEECVILPRKVEYVVPFRREYAISPTSPEVTVDLEPEVTVDAQAAFQALLLRNAELEAKLRRLQAERRQRDYSGGFNLRLTTNEKIRRITYTSTTYDHNHIPQQPVEVYSSSPELRQSPLYSSLVPSQYPGSHAMPSYPHLVPIPPVISLNAYSPVVCSQTQFQPYNVRLLPQLNSDESPLLPQLNPDESSLPRESPVLRERARHENMVNLPPANHSTADTAEPAGLYRNGSVTLNRDCPTRICSVTSAEVYDLSTKSEPNNDSLHDTSSPLDLNHTARQPVEVYSSSPELRQSPLYCSQAPPQYSGSHALPPYPHIVPSPPVIPLNAYSPVVRSQTQYQPYSVSRLPQNTDESSLRRDSPVLRERARHENMVNLPPANHSTADTAEPAGLYRNCSVTPNGDRPMRICSATPAEAYDLSTKIRPNNDKDSTHDIHHDNDTRVSSSQSTTTADSTDKNKPPVKGLKKRWLEDYSHDP